MKIILSIINKAIFLLLFVILSIGLPLILLISNLQNKVTLLEETFGSTPMALELDMTQITDTVVESIPSQYQHLIQPLTQAFSSTSSSKQMLIIFIIMISILYLLLILTEQGSLLKKTKKTTITLFLSTLITRKINLYLTNIMLNLIKPYINITSLLPNLKSIITDPKKFEEMSSTFSNMIKNIQNDMIFSINIVYKWIYGILLAVLLFTFIIPALPNVIEDYNEESENEE